MPKEARKLVRRKSLGGEGAPGVEGGGPSGPQTQPLLTSARQGDQADFEYPEWLRGRDNFSENRSRCIFNTKRAYHTLTNWARLDVKVISAQNLPQPVEAVSKFGDQSGNYYVAAYYDDALVYNTQSIRRPAPEWQHDGYINVFAPDSIIRLHLMHDGESLGPEEIGFVDIGVEDLELNKPIEGYLELRLQNRLLQRGKDRYRDHCKGRDEYRKLDTVANVAHKDHQAKRFNLFRMCSSAHAGIGDERTHAGEIKVRLELKLLGGWGDKFFGFAMKAPRGKNYGGARQSESTEVQEVYDRAMECKRVFYDECLWCVLNWIAYILRWRFFLLSFFFVGAVMVSGYATWTQFPMIFLVISVTMTVNSFESQRYAMTWSGRNAPLNEDGFNVVAAMRSTNNMVKYLHRVVNQSLWCTCEDHNALRFFASKCFREGVPLKNLETVMKSLEELPFIKKVDPLAPGSRVLVDGEFLAKVRSIDEPKPETSPHLPPRLQRKVFVDYEPDTIHGAPQVITERECEVEMERLQARSSWDKIPDFLIPPQVQEQIGVARHHLLDIQEKARPALAKATDVVTWKNVWLARAITWTFFFLAVTVGLFREYYRMCGGVEMTPFQTWFKRTLEVQCGDQNVWKQFESGTTAVVHYLLLFLLQRGFIAILLLVVVAFLVSQAQWLKPIKAVCRICKYSCCKKRRAPTCWQFYSAEGVPRMGP